MMVPLWLGFNNYILLSLQHPKEASCFLVDSYALQYNSYKQISFRLSNCYLLPAPYDVTQSSLYDFNRKMYVPSLWKANHWNDSMRINIHIEMMMSFFIFGCLVNDPDCVLFSWSVSHHPVSQFEMIWDEIESDLWVVIRKTVLFC